MRRLVSFYTDKGGDPEIQYQQGELLRKRNNELNKINWNYLAWQVLSAFIHMFLGLTVKDALH